LRHVIIGSSAAGIASAKTLRSIRKDDKIIIISSDNVNYSRCMLHKYVCNERNLENLSFIPDNFFSTNNITWYKGENVKGIDTKNNNVLLQDKIISYDKLLITTGSDSVIPDVGELRTATNVHGFMHLTDAEMIREKAVNGKKVLIIGAGLAGIDAAYALLKLKKVAVTVVEMSSHIMSLNLDSTAANVYQKIFEQNGCSFHLNSKITGTVSNENGEITHIVLEAGEKLSCDLVIVAAGVKPSVKFLEGSGIECGQGIKVDQYLNASCENVYAAGNVTALGGIWQCAVRQGEVAAKNMCGIKTPFTDTFTAKSAMNFFDLSTLSIGNVNHENSDTVLTRKNSSCYQKIVLRNNTVIGVVLQGNIAHSGIWQYLIKNKLSINNFKKSVWTICFADFYSIDEKGQYTYRI